MIAYACKLGAFNVVICPEVRRKLEQDSSINLARGIVEVWQHVESHKVPFPRYKRHKENHLYLHMMDIISLHDTKPHIKVYGTCMLSYSQSFVRE